VPDAPAGANVWQLPQPLEVNSPFPLEALPPVPGLVGLGPVVAPVLLPPPVEFDGIDAAPTTGMPTLLAPDVFVPCQ